MPARVALAVAVLLLLWGVPELVLRASWTPPPNANEIVGTRGFVEWLEGLAVEGLAPGVLYEEDRDRLWRLVPGAVVETRNYHAADREHAPPTRISINDRGYRGPVAAERRASTLRVVCMGDSNFFGYPLDDAQAFPSALQRALQRRGSGNAYEVLNAGVPGYSVVQGLRWFREDFARLEPDVLLLSYLNNDAWRQPYTDSSLMARSAAPVRWLRFVRERSYLAQYVASFVPAPDEEDMTPRVPLPEFRATYRAFFKEAAAMGTRAIVLDYRTEEAYRPYSDALRALSREHGAEYVFVLERIVEAQQRGAARTSHLSLLRAVVKRWGPEQLRAHPHLAYYAETQPEHLNEIGAAILADEIAQRLEAGEPR